MRTAHPAGQGSLPALASVTTLFFAWGFATSIIDTLVPMVRSVFSLSFTEAMLTQFAFFLAYGVVSLPAALLVGRLGYPRAIVLSLGIMILACLGMPLATSLGHYSLVLCSLFVLACGITILQVSANPLCAHLGRPEDSHRRLTLSQAFNSLGTVAGPLVGSALLLSGGVFALGNGDAGRTAAQVAQSLRRIDMQFLGIAVGIALLALLIWSMRRELERHGGRADGGQGAPVAQAFRSAWAVFGAVALFLYVGAEVSIGAAMINLLEQPEVLNAPAATAGHLLSLYWGGAMVGRFIGGAMLSRVEAGKLLAVVAAVAGLLCLAVSGSTGVLAAVCALSIGLFNAVMFPTIFTLTLERSSAPPAATSGLLCMAIVGGAVVPLATGMLADRAGLSFAFLVPAACYAGIAVFSVTGLMSRTRRSVPESAVAAVH